MATFFKESVTLQKVSVLFVVFFDGLPLRLGLPPQCNGGDGDLRGLWCSQGKNGN